MNRATLTKDLTADGEWYGYMEKEALLSGFLKKYANAGRFSRFRSRSRRWLRRWYEIRGPYLMYYSKQREKQNDSPGENIPAGIIDLRNIQSISVISAAESSCGRPVLLLGSAVNDYRFREGDLVSLSKWHEMLQGRAAESQCPEFVETLRAFYLNYNPSRIGSAPLLALRFKFRQEELLQAIHEKYRGGKFSSVGTPSTKVIEIERLERGESFYGDDEENRILRHSNGSTRRRNGTIKFEYELGDTVYARWNYRGGYRLGKIVRAHEAGLYDVEFDDNGMIQESTLANLMRPAPQQRDENSEDGQELGNIHASRNPLVPDGDIEMADIHAESPGASVGLKQRMASDKASGAGLHEAIENRQDRILISNGGDQEEEEEEEEAEETDEEDLDISKERLQERLDSMVEGVREGFYTLGASILLDETRPAMTKLRWLIYTIFLFLG